MEAHKTTGDGSNESGPGMAGLDFGLSHISSPVSRCLRWLALAMITAIVTSCHVYDEVEPSGPNREREVTISNSPNETEGEGGDSLSHDGPLSDGQATYVAELLETNADAPGWPDRPRRAGTFSASQENESTISLGARASFFGLIEGEAKSTTVFAMGHTTTLMLVRTSAGGVAPLTSATPEGGEVLLNYEEGVDFVGQCVFEATLSLGQRFAGSADVMGNSAGNEQAADRVAEVAASTNFFNIMEGDTVELLLDQCDTVFDVMVRHSVAVDLRRLVAASLELSEFVDEDHTHRALKAATTGPADHGLEMYGHTWNVHPLSWERSGPNEETFEVWGTLDNPRPSLLRERHVDFNYVFRDGKLVGKPTISVNPNGEGWEQNASELATMLAEEVYLEYRVGMENMQPGPARVVTVRTSCDSDEGAVELGTGRYSEGGLARKELSGRTLSSLTVPQGYRVVLFSEPEFEGEMSTYTAGTTCLPEGWNNRALSLVVEPDPDDPRRYQLRNHDREVYLAARSLDDTSEPTFLADGGEQWVIRHVSDGYYAVVHQDGNKLMDPGEGGPGLSLEGEHEAQWALAPTGARAGALVLVNRESGLALTVVADTAGESVPWLEKPDHRPAQAWSFE